MSKENKSMYGILSLLSKQALSGYDIKQMAIKVSPFHWTENNAQIYPILKKLNAEGLVKAQIDESSGERNRCIYTITSKGLEHLKTWLEQPVQPSPYREELLLKLTAGEHVPVAIMLEHIEKFKTQVLQQQKIATRIQQEIESNQKNSLRRLYLKMTYQFAEFNLNAKLDWCDQALAELSAYAKNQKP